MPLDINLRAPINKLGYGYTGLNIVHNLVKQGENVALWPIGNIEADEPYHASILQAINAQAFFNRHAPSLILYHQFALAETIGKGTSIGFPIFELNSFNDREHHHLNSVDKLFVCSKWAQEVIRDTLKKDATVIPLGVDLDIFKPVDINTTVPTFFNIGKWEIRKGHDVLLDAFCRAFGPDDKVRLIVAAHNPFLTHEENKEWEDYYTSKSTDSRQIVVIKERFNSQASLATLIEGAHCGIFLARAEGWNLEALECLAMGRELITLNYSGNTEFCNHENSYLVEIDKLESAHDGKWFFGQGEWAEIGEVQIEQIVSHLRFIYSRIEAKKLNKVGIETAKQFTWGNTTKTIMENI